MVADIDYYKAIPAAAASVDEVGRDDGWYKSYLREQSSKR